MAKTILKDCSVVVNSVDVSAYVDSVEITSSIDDVDVTAMGATAREHLPGLRDDEIVCNFLQSFPELDGTLWPLMEGATEFTVVIKPTTSAVSSSNPSFTASCFLLEYSPLAGSVGERSETSVTFTCNGAITRAIT